jgi:ABC-type Fe3+ transport system permease subunit/DNA-binding beta-propeller fold protein YncE
MRVLVQNSLLVAGLTTVLGAGLGFMAALFLAALNRRWRHALLVLVIAALAMPPFLVTNCWLDLLGANGALHRWFPVEIFHSPSITAGLLALLTWPLTTLAVTAAWQRSQPSLLECEPALRGIALVRWLLWPQARRATGFAAALTFVLALNNFAVPTILQVRVLPAEMWVGFNTNLDSGAALKAGWPLLVAPLALLWLLGWREFRWPRLESSDTAKLCRRQLGSLWFAACGLGTAVLLALSIGAPLAQLVLSRRTWLELLPAFSAGTAAMGNSIFNGVLTATVTIAACLLVGSFLKKSPPGFGVRREAPLSDATNLNAVLASRTLGKRHYRSALQDAGAHFGAALLWLPFFVPGIFLGLLLIWALNRPGVDWFYRSSGVVLLALALRYFGPAWFGAALARQSVDQDLLDAGRLEGARGWALFRHVLWPQMAPHLAATWYVIFLLCLWDVETLVLILPPGGETLASRLFNLLHYGHSGQVNALCVWLLVVVLAPLALWRLGRGMAGRLTQMFHTPTTPPGGSAGFQPAVSRVSNPPDAGVGTTVCRLAVGDTAGWKPALHGFGAALLVGLVGCSPSQKPSRVPIQSQLFAAVEEIGSRGAGVGEFNKPRSLALDTNDNLYVADMTGRVQKFSREGKYLLSWQMPQTDLGKPKGMGRDRDGNIVIIEPHYQRVNHFSAEGKLVAQWGGHLTNGGPFSLPRAVAVNSRNEIVMSEYTLAERVQVFSALGRRRLFEFGHSGTGPGEFNRPEGVAVDAADRIYVADSCNHRLQVFTAEGKLLRAYGKAGRGPGEFSYPYDVQVDAAGRQYVCEFGNSRIQIFDAHDQLVEVLGGPGSAPGRFANPWSIALDSAGNLYVADSQNHRVQKFLRRSL